MKSGDGSMNGGPRESWVEALQNNDSYGISARCLGLPFPQRLQITVHQIFVTPNPIQYQALMEFLTSEVPLLNPTDQERLARDDLPDLTSGDAIKLQDNKFILSSVLEQWRSLYTSQLRQPLPSADMDYHIRHPGPSRCTEDSIATSTQQTPADTPSGQIIVSPPPASRLGLESSRVMITRAEGVSRCPGQLVITPDTRAGAQQAAIEHAEIALITKGVWQDMWGALVGSWSDSTGVPFPSFDSSTKKWLLAVRAEPERSLFPPPYTTQRSQ